MFSSAHTFFRRYVKIITEKFRKPGKADRRCRFNEAVTMEVVVILMVMILVALVTPGMVTLDNQILFLRLFSSIPDNPSFVK